jgi:phosphatidylserine decarboxylase
MGNFVDIVFNDSSLKTEASMKRQIAKFFFIFLPKAFLSRIFGFFARRHLPKKMLFSIIRWYCRKYGVLVDEIDEPEKGFFSLESFFTRRVKQGTHRIDADPLTIVSPVDARVDQFGDITGTRIMQAKNIDYLVSELLPSSIHHAFLDGKFITLYLSPGDYHRIHAPVDGAVMSGLHIPGKLFPVQEFMVNGYQGLFSKNERVITYLQTDSGICAVCKIGAMNVGRISVTYADITSNKSMFRKRQEVSFSERFRPYMKKGDHLGTFHLGSTVIILFQKDMVTFDRLYEGQKVRMGQRIAVSNRKTSK